MVTGNVVQGTLFKVDFDTIVCFSLVGVAPVQILMSTASQVWVLLNGYQHNYIGHRIRNFGRQHFIYYL